MVVKRIHINLLSIFVLLFSAPLFSQGHLYSDVRINKSSVYVGEPVQVTVGVFTDTWFTKGIDLGNVKVNNAFTVYFRSVSTSKVIRGKKYAGVEFIYNVIPYKNTPIEFPSLTVHVESPDPNDYKGKKKQLQTPKRTITVKNIPPDFDKDSWIVTNSLTVNENWQGNTNSVKVGDVLVRKISRSASGTVAELLPPIVWDSVSGVSNYEMRPVVNTKKTKTYISASRVDGVQYLFEKEGAIEFPEKVITWYHPIQKKLYKKTLTTKTINVLPNPDSGILATLKDSLALTVQAPKEDVVAEEEPFTILGMSPKKAALVFVILILSSLLLVRIIKRGIAYYKAYRKEYMYSEKYYFNAFMKLRTVSDSKKYTNAMYQWLSSVNNPNGITLQEACVYIKSDSLKLKVQSLEKSLRTNNKPIAISVKDWKNIRTQLLRFNVKANNSSNSLWINP